MEITPVTGHQSQLDLFAICTLVLIPALAVAQGAAQSVATHPGTGDRRKRRGTSRRDGHAQKPRATGSVHVDALPTSAANTA